MTIVIILFYLIFPALLIYLGTRFPIINKIGVVVLCYVGGLIVGNINGLGNFIDVFETCNRLLYVYGKRGVIPKPWVVGKIAENIVIFT